MVKENSKGNSLLEVSAGDGKYRVIYTGMQVGHDFIVLIQGGTGPHIGAVAVGIPRPGIRDPKKVSATASVLTLVGHKDDEIARTTALCLATELSRVVVVIAGLHIDAATEKDIAMILENSTLATDMLVEAIQKEENKKSEIKQTPRDTIVTS